MYILCIIYSMYNVFMLCHPAKPQVSVVQENKEHLKSEEEENVDQDDLDHIEEVEDPYDLCPEDIYYTVDSDTYNPAILNRPPATIPRPEHEPESEKPMTYISRGIVQSVFLFPIMF